MGTQRPRRADLGRAVLGLAVLLLAPVVAAGCIQGEGPLVTEPRDSRPFTNVEAGAGIHVVIHVGPAASVVVEAQEDLLPVIATDVSGDTLHVESVDDFTSSEPVTVTVTTPVLEGIHAGGGATVHLDEAVGERLELTVKGGARLTASGSATDVTLQADGGSSVELADLLATRTHVDLDGGATATVSASQVVDGRAGGGARLTVRGDPVVDVQTSGGAVVARP
jgi:hypothetical protein